MKKLLIVGISFLVVGSAFLAISVSQYVQLQNALEYEKKHPCRLANPIGCIPYLPYSRNAIIAAILMLIGVGISLVSIKNIF